MKFINLRDRLIKISAIVLVTVLLYFVLSDVYLYQSCFGAAKRIPSVETFVQIRFVIYGSSDDTVSGRFRLYDNMGREIAVIERSWPGGTLFIDYVSAEFSGKKFQFPLRIYTHDSRFKSFSKNSGTQLSSYYMSDGLFRIYDIKGNEKDFKQLAQYALRPDFFGRSQWVSGLSHSGRQSLNLGGCEPGKTYTVVTDFSGSLALFSE